MTAINTTKPITKVCPTGRIENINHWPPLLLRAVDSAKNVRGILKKGPVALEPTMTKVGIISFANAEGGGVYQYTQSIVETLEQDSSLEYVVFCHENEARFDGAGLEVRKVHRPAWSRLFKGIRVLQLATGLRQPFGFTGEERRMYEDIDLFLVPFIEPYPHFYLGKPFIFTLHDMQEKYYPRFFSLRVRLRRRLLNGALARAASRIVCESRYVARDIQRFTGVAESKIATIPAPPPLDITSFTFSEKEATRTRQKHGLPERYIFYPANFWHHKNHLKLLDAFNLISPELPDLHLILTGGKGNAFCATMERVASAGLTEKVRHLGYLDYEEMPYIYKLASALVMPSLFESVSIPIYEAFYLETPVCCSNILALPEQVGDAGLTFDPQNAADMAEKITECLSNERLSAEMTRKGKERVMSFDNNSYRRSFVGIIHGALRSAGLSSI